MKGQVSTRTKVLHALMIVVLTILLLLFIAPFILVVINVFKTKADINTAPLALIGKHGFTLENFPRAMDKMNFVTVFGNSAVITISATILTILFSAMCAYVIVRNPSWKFGGMVFAPWNMNTARETEKPVCMRISVIRLFNTSSRPP